MQQNPDTPSISVATGVAGPGKTAVGERLAERPDGIYQGDRLHPPDNVAKMQSGHPLIEVDRASGLAAIAKASDGLLARTARGISTCSALKHDYRRRIIGDRGGERLVFRNGGCELIGRRLAARQGHLRRRACLTVSLRLSNLQVLTKPNRLGDRATDRRQNRCGPPADAGAELSSGVNRQMETGRWRKA